MPYQKNNTYSDLLSKAEHHFQQKLPGVLFVHPNEDTVQLVCQKDDELQRVQDFKETGFVFGSFLGDKPPVLIKPDLRFSSPKPQADISSPREKNQFAETKAEKVRYTALINKTVTKIKSGAFRKVVLSRRINTTTEKKPFEIFTDTAQRYPNALCYYWYHPKVGTWIGATPEILLKKDGSQFTSVALAGTIQKTGETPVWGHKEKEEQQMVTDYVKKVLSPIIEKLEVSKVQTVDAGSLWHLKSTISGECKPEQIGVLLNVLHPTPAVCGMPMEAARSYILKNEGYARKYYTGYLGTLNLDAKLGTSLYVNLRCMEIKDRNVSIYVGGGVTGESEAVSEYEETVAKSKIMLAVL